MFSDLIFSKITPIVDDIEEIFNGLVEYNNNEFYYFILTNNEINHNDENVNNYIENSSN